MKFFLLVASVFAVLSLFAYGQSIKAESISAASALQAGKLVSLEGKVVSETAFASGSFLLLCSKKCSRVVVFGKVGFIGKSVSVEGVSGPELVITARKIEVV